VRSDDEGKSIGPGGIVALGDIKHMVWDWNGTLLDDLQLVLDIMAGLLREYNLPELDFARYLDIFEFPAQEYYQKLGFGDGHPRFETLATRFMEQYDRRVLECPLHAEARESLERFRESGIVNYVLTAGNQASVEQQIRHYGLRGLVSEVVGNSDHFAGPKDALGVAWLNERRFDPGSMAFLGDTIHDFEVASVMKVRCVLVSHGHNSLRRLLACGCPVVLSLGSVTV
jgi:phosphoglycolate phosphatase